MTAPTVPAVDVGRMVAGAHDLLDSAIAQHFNGSTRLERRELAGIVCHFSGGNDSTVLAHMFRSRATHYGHANTGIGIEQTRQFVRDACAAWGVPLLERYPPAGSTYAELVTERGFPGPAMHYKMYQRLKQRAFEQMQRELIAGAPYRRRVIFLAGRRADESGRRTARADRGELLHIERRKSVVWVSPLLDWSAEDLRAYRAAYPDCPRNEVTDHLHMSGECLCGAFATAGELDEISFFYPDMGEHIRDLERKVTAAGNAPAARCRWGWKTNQGARCMGCVS